MSSTSYSTLFSVSLSRNNVLIFALLGYYFFLRYGASPIPGKKFHAGRYELTPTIVDFRLMILIHWSDMELTESRFQFVVDGIVREPAILRVVNIHDLVD